MTRALITLAIAIAVLVAAAPAHADKRPKTAAAQARFAAGSEAYAAHDFARAASEFEAGFAAEPWAGFLFAWGQAERRRGDCKKAVELFDRFLATGPKPKAEQQARTGLALCAAGSTGTAEPTADGVTTDDVTDDDDKPLPAQPVTDPRTDTRDPRTDHPRPRGFQHKLAVGLVAGGVVVGGVAGYVYYLARRDARDAPGLPTLPEVEARYDRAESRLTIARVAAVVGGGLVIGGVLRFILHRPARQDAPEISISPTGEVVLWGRF